MKNPLVNNGKDAFLRYDKKMARRVFNEYGKIYVMTIDRDPITSLTEPHRYIRGEKTSLMDKDKIISNFDELLYDFSEWLSTIGYGNKPQRYKAKKQMFSYWFRLF